MPWLQRNAWWGLLALAAASSVLGIAYLVSGDTYLAQDLTGTTLGQIAAESSAAGRLIDLLVRTAGVYLIALGVALGAILFFAFRQDRAWAWWTMWTLPVLAIATALLSLAAGVGGPALSGSIAGVVAAALLLISAPRFRRTS